MVIVGYFVRNYWISWNGGCWGTYRLIEWGFGCLGRGDFLGVEINLLHEIELNWIKLSFVLGHR